MAERTDQTAPPLMRPYVPPPSPSAELRTEMARTRQRLTASLAKFQELSSPAHLLATGARSLRHEAARRLMGLAGGALRHAVATSALGSRIALIASVVSRLVPRRARTRSGSL